MVGRPVGQSLIRNVKICLISLVFLFFVFVLYVIMPRCQKQYCVETPVPQKSGPQAKHPGKWYWQCPTHKFSHFLTDSECAVLGNSAPPQVQQPQPQRGEKRPRGVLRVSEDPFWSDESSSSETYSPPPPPPRDEAIQAQHDLNAAHHNLNRRFEQNLSDMEGGQKRLMEMLTKNEELYNALNRFVVEMIQKDGLVKDQVRILVTHAVEHILEEKKVEKEKNGKKVYPE
jgi:hypothetical protein